ncbi:hypothetical protein HII13_000604 [Brettanomyces bruxellensis]|nr:hypothetical protein HII13_000604 [Brettanomyces bruxellensis]
MDSLQNTGEANDDPFFEGRLQELSKQQNRKWIQQRNKQWIQQQIQQNQQQNQQQYHQQNQQNQQQYHQQNVQYRQQDQNQYRQMDQQFWQQFRQQKRHNHQQSQQQNQQQNQHVLQHVLQQQSSDQSHDQQDSRQYSQMFPDNVIQEKYQLDPSLQFDLIPYNKQDELFSNLPMKYQLDLAQPQYSADAPLYFPQTSTDELTRRNENANSPSSFSLPDTFESEDADLSINESINNIRNAFSSSYTNLNSMDSMAIARNFSVPETSSLELGGEIKAATGLRADLKESLLVEGCADEASLVKKLKPDGKKLHRKGKSVKERVKEEEADMFSENLSKYPTGVCNRCKKTFAQMGTRSYRNCMHCRKLQRGRSKRWQLKIRNKVGLCRRCGARLGPEEANYVQCRQCRSALRLRKHRRATEGKCVHCSGPNEDLSGKYKVCSKCRKREKLIREIRRQTGMCNKCGRLLSGADQGFKSCKRCRATRHGRKIVRSMSMNLTTRMEGVDIHLDSLEYPNETAGGNESNNNQQGSSRSRRFFSEPPSECIPDFEPTIASPSSQMRRRESVSTVHQNAEMSPIFVDDLIMPHLPQDTHPDTASG